MNNPLLNATGLPPFHQIQPEHVQPALTQLLAESRGLVERLTQADVPATWNDFAAPMAQGLERLVWSWGIVGHLHSVNDIPPWRDAYNATLPDVTRFYSELGQNLALFEKYKAIRNSTEYAALSPARKKIIDNEIRDFRLSGAELPEKDKPRFQAIQEELASLAAKFSENLLDATNAFAEVIIHEVDLAGLPEDTKLAAKAAAEASGIPGWKFTLQAPSYLPVMQYAENRPLRARMYRAYATRASEFADSGSRPEWDNTGLMTRILALRQEEAKLLGYKNFAELSLVSKMAESPAQVLGFLEDMAVKAKPFAEKDKAALEAFAATKLGITQMEPWDVAYVSEKMLQARYAFSEQEVRQYFTEPRVIDGLFKVIKTLFGVRITPDTAPVWEDTVRFYRIETGEGKLVGQFYMDLYARETKRGGAWMNEAVARHRSAQGIETPVAYLNCNFSKPQGDKPATFTHDEVITLFHESGHGFHHLLTQAEELGVSGIRGVEWDAVELPSQFMENFCWEWDVLKDMTAHVDTGAPLPKELFEKMLAAKNYQSGLMTVRQLEFSLFDVLIHSEFDPTRQNIMELLGEVRKKVAVFIPPAWHRFPNSFAHIFAGGYAAGYYSYKWAEVLSADAYAAFEETGNPLNQTTGQRFLAEILSMGGTRPALESFKAFRGRDPKPDALLRHSGMILE